MAGKTGQGRLAIEVGHAQAYAETLTYAGQQAGRQQAVAAEAEEARLATTHRAFENRFPALGQRLLMGFQRLLRRGLVTTLAECAGHALGQAATIDLAIAVQRQAWQAPQAFGPHRLGQALLQAGLERGGVEP